MNITLYTISLQRAKLYPKDNLWGFLFNKKESKIMNKTGFTLIELNIVISMSYHVSTNFDTCSLVWTISTFLLDIRFILTRNYK